MNCSLILNFGPDQTVKIENKLVNNKFRQMLMLKKTKNDVRKSKRGNSIFSDN